MSSFRSPVQDPAANLDHVLDLSDWLQSGETISSITVEVSGATLSSSTNDSDTITAWVTGGTAGTLAVISYTFTTTEPRTDKRRVVIPIVNR